MTFDPAKWYVGRGVNSSAMYSPGFAAHVQEFRNMGIPEHSYHQLIASGNYSGMLRTGSGINDAIGAYRNSYTYSGFYIAPLTNNNNVTTFLKGNVLNLFVPPSVQAYFVPYSAIDMYYLEGGWSFTRPIPDVLQEYLIGQEERKFGHFPLTHTLADFYSLLASFNFSHNGRATWLNVTYNEQTNTYYATEWLFGGYDSSYALTNPVANMPGSYVMLRFDHLAMVPLTLRNSVKAYTVGNNLAPPLPPKPAYTGLSQDYYIIKEPIEDTTAVVESAGFLRAQLAANIGYVDGGDFLIDQRISALEQKVMYNERLNSRPLRLPYLFLGDQCRIRYVTELQADGVQRPQVRVEFAEVALTEADFAWPNGRAYDTSRQSVFRTAVPIMH